MEIYNTRKDVPEKYKWDLTDFFKNEEEFNKSLDETAKLIDELKDYNDCTSDINRLYEYLMKEREAVALCLDLYVYAFLICDQELGVKESIERNNKVELLNVQLEKNTSFFAPLLLQLDEKTYSKLSNNPKLIEFKADLDSIYRKKEHVLKENEEIIVSSLVGSMNHFESMCSTLINSEHDYGKVVVDGKKIDISTTNYRHLMKNKDFKVRKKVRDNFNKTLDQYGSTCASLLSSYVSMNDTIAKLRHFDSAWTQKMFDLNLNSKVFDTLVKTVENNYDTIQRYYELKRKVLGLKELTGYDVSLDIISNDKEYSIEEAQELCLNAVKPLGEDYCKRFKKIFDNRYIDYCQYKGKWSGGYCASSFNHDSRILMSYTGSFDSVSTIIHEGGHLLHHQLVAENNFKQYQDMKSIVAEVSSLTNECLLTGYLSINGKTKEEKLTGIANILGVIANNLFDACREGKMEQEMYDYVHNGNILTKEYLDKLTYDSLAKLYGTSVKYDNQIKNSWITRSHYYMNFYLYSYSICISVACSVASKILAGDQKMLVNYMKFLKTGSDKWPSEAFAVLGIDLEDKSVYENAIKYFDSMIDKFYEILDEKEVK